MGAHHGWPDGWAVIYEPSDAAHFIPSRWLALVDQHFPGWHTEYGPILLKHDATGVHLGTKGIARTGREGGEYDNQPGGMQIDGHDWLPYYLTAKVAEPIPAILIPFLDKERIGT